MCWFTPDQASHVLIKSHAQCIVDEIRRLNQIGDPIGISLEEAKELLDHLYYPDKCTEKNEPITQENSESR